MRDWIPAIYLVFKQHHAFICARFANDLMLYEATEKYARNSTQCSWNSFNSRRNDGGQAFV